MSSIKKIIIAISCIHSSAIFAQDYFNPLFLGSDIDNVADLTYLNNGNDFVPGEYFLDIYVGDTFIDNVKINFFEDRKTTKVVPCFTKDIINIMPLNEAALSGMHLDKFSKNSCIDISKSIPEFSYSIDMVSSSLKLSFPQIYLKSILSSLAPEKYWDDGINALLVNYTFSGSYTKNHNSDNAQSYYLNLNNRFNWGPWRFYESAYLNSQKNGSSTHTEVKSSNFYVQREFSSIKSGLTVGQSNLGSNLFDSFQYVGVNLSTSTNLLPQSERGYAPPIRGIVDSRSKVVIRQNGYIVYQTYVDPGPYDIPLNAVGSSGDFEVEVTGADGNVTVTNVPYSTITNLLKDGAYEYSVTAGYLDNSGTKKRIFAQANYTRGLSMKVTSYMGTQLSSDYRSLGFGLARDFGSLGAVSVDFITAKTILDNGSTNSGQSYRILYGKNISSTGTNFQIAGYRYSTSGYYSFTESAYKKSSYDNVTGSYSNSSLFGKKKNDYQINITQKMYGDLGQIYFWGNKAEYWGDDVSTNIQLGWSKTFDFLTGLTVNLTYNKYRYNDDKQNYFYLSFNLPLTSRMSENNFYLSNSLSYNTSTHDVSNNASIYGSAFDSKLTFNAYENANNHNSPRNSGGLTGTYYGSMAKVTLGTSLNSDVKRFDYGISGGLLAHSDGITLTRESYDTATLIEAKGAEGTKVVRGGDNLSINGSGYALVPYVQPYRFNDIELDASSFNDTFDVDDKVLRTVPTKGAITKVKFNVLSGYNFLVELDYQGKKVPFGANVKNTVNGQVAMVNDDGSVYVSGVNDGSSFVVTLSEGESCSFKINFPDNFIPNVVNKMNLSCF